MMKTRKKAKSPKRQEVSYCIEIEKWEMPYSFSIPPRKDIVEGPFWEHATLRISGKLLHPEKLVGKDINVYIIMDRRYTTVLESPEKFSQEPERIGTLTIRGDHREYLGSLPFDAMQTICLLLQGENIKYVMLGGPSLYRGESAIRSIHFDKVYNPEDWM